MNKQYTQKTRTMNELKKLEFFFLSRGFIGHKIGNTRGIRGVHPSMTSALSGMRKTISIIDISFTLKNLIKILYIIFSVLNRNGHILIVNTDSELSGIVHYFVKKTNQFGYFFSYCNNKWVGGTLTNWKQIAISITTFLSFSTRFDKFVTKNNIYFPKYRKLKSSFQGMKYFKEGFAFQQKKIKSINHNFKESTRKFTLKKPDLVLLLNPNENKTVLYEAKKLNIPVIALTDSNTDLTLISYSLPVNNTSPFVIQYLFFWIFRLIVGQKRQKSI